ncbi:MAG: DUF4956 domain-containing protein [Oscillospiraceae bacterium]|nr:DUF4956 domain-containing protein [Oscillospiraceae bacterium]
MSIQDIIKKSFLQQFATDVSTPKIVVVLALTAVIGIYIFFVYRITCRKAFYSRSFAISLVVNGMVTASIIMAMQSNVVISLGMVGALSIVRFRTAIKDPMDLGYLFWSISVGIICGAGLVEIALLASVMITMVMLFLHFVPNAKPALLLIVSAESADTEQLLVAVLKKDAKYFKIKSRNVTASGVDMIVELKTKQEHQLISDVSALEGIRSASLMTHDGEITY